MTRPFFSKDRISHFEIFDRHAADAIEQVKARMKQGYAVDVQASIYAICFAYFSPPHRTSCPGSLLTLRRSPSSECMRLDLGCYITPNTHDPISQGRSLTIGRAELPPFCFHQVI